MFTLHVELPLSPQVNMEDIAKRNAEAGAAGASHRGRLGEVAIGSWLMTIQCWRIDDDDDDDNSVIINSYHNKHRDTNIHIIQDTMSSSKYDIFAIIVMILKHKHRIIVLLTIAFPWSLRNDDDNSNFQLWSMKIYYHMLSSLLLLSYFCGGDILATAISLIIDSNIAVWLLFLIIIII